MNIYNRSLTRDGNRIVHLFFEPVNSRFLFEGQVVLSSACPLFMSHFTCKLWEDTKREQYCVFSQPMSCRAAHSRSQWRSCLLILFYVVMFSFRWKNLPVISVFDILHVVSFNHSGLHRLLAWLGAEQTSAQHWTFCTDWIMAFLKSFKLGNSLDICLVTMQWRMFVFFTSCNCVVAVNLKHLFRLILVTSPNAMQEFSSGQSWTQVSSSLLRLLGNWSEVSFKKWFLSKPKKLSIVSSFSW